MNPETLEFHSDKIVKALVEKATNDEKKTGHHRPAARIDAWKHFDLGECFVLHGVEMRIRKITQKDVILRPVKIVKSFIPKD